MGNDMAHPVCNGDTTVMEDIILAPCMEQTALGHHAEFVSRQAPSIAGEDVRLNIYHLDDTWTDSNHVSKQVFGLGGAFHVGIEFAGREWTYGTAGVSCGAPRCHPVHVFHDSIVLGQTSVSPRQMQALVARMATMWHGEDYHMLEKNCCSFADALSLSLVGEHLPQWVSRFPQLASEAARHLDNIIDVKGLMQESVAPAGPMYETFYEDISPAAQRPLGFGRVVRAH
jgi:hypothetical protein